MRSKSYKKLLKTWKVEATFTNCIIYGPRDLKDEQVEEISKNMVEQLLIRNKELPPTKIVEITNLVGCSAIKK